MLGFLESKFFKIDFFVNLNKIIIKSSNKSFDKFLWVFIIEIFFKSYFLFKKYKFFNASFVLFMNTWFVSKPKWITGFFMKWKL